MASSCSVEAGCGPGDSWRHPRHGLQHECSCHAEMTTASMRTRAALDRTKYRHRITGGADKSPQRIPNHGSHDDGR
jgi:hypothetical protein